MSAKEVLIWSIDIHVKMLTIAVTATLALIATAGTAFVKGNWWLMGLAGAGSVFAVCGILTIVATLLRYLRELKHYD